MNGLRLWAACRIPGMHPDISNLLGWADGERISAIASHLKRCGQCRQQAHLIADAASAKDEVSNADRSKEMYDRLQIQMQAWSCLRGPAERGRVRRRQQMPRLSEALEFYFGIELASRIENAARWDTGDANVIPVTKPLFTTFLGKRAAEMLAQKLAGATT
ncbi:MAG: hypothetical protein JO061_11525 [Acidobacteriaceae bacterium]|nr:hypothetical protein [Acidobacteriaceae bacterium]